MQKVAVIGAGISGLFIVQHYHITAFEKDARPSGVVKCDRIDRHLFHRTGGHIFNTKNKDVSEWFWEHLNKNKEFVKVNRYFVVYMPERHVITYPVQRMGIRELIANLKSITEKEEFDLLEKYEEWKYYNMDAAM